MFLLECAIALAQFSSAYHSTILVLDDGLHGLDQQRRQKYFAQTQGSRLPFSNSHNGRRCNDGHSMGWMAVRKLLKPIKVLATRSRSTDGLGCGFENQMVVGDHC
jgi:hypothetical protein